MFSTRKLLRSIPSCVQLVGPSCNTSQNTYFHMNRTCSLTHLKHNFYVNIKYKLKSYYFGSKNYILPHISSDVLQDVNKKFFRIININSFHSTSQCDDIDRMVPRNQEEAQKLLTQSPIFNPDAKLLRIAIIGVPNSGKSTLINQLIGWKVCSVSPKVHTTICSARAVSNHDDTQLVYLDTPGIVTPEEIKKYKLTHSLVVDPEKSLENCDLIAVMHDTSNSYTHKQLHPRVLRLLLLYPTVPSILILNKVDVIKKKTVLLPVTTNLTEGIVGDTRPTIIVEKDQSDMALRASLLNICTSEESSVQSNNVETSNNELDDIHYNKLDDNTKLSIHSYEKEFSEEHLKFEDVISGRVKPTEKQVQKLLQDRNGWPLFKEVFMISALDGTGVDDLREYFLSSAKKAQWIFTDDVVTDQTPQEIALMTVRENYMKMLPKSFPYELKFKIMNWEMSDSEVLSILISVYCKRKNQMKYLVGGNGSSIRRLALSVEQELRNTFRTEVRLRLNAEYNPDVESDI